MTCQGGVVVIRNYLELMAPNEKYQDHILLGKKLFSKNSKKSLKKASRSIYLKFSWVKLPNTSEKKSRGFEKTW